MQKRPFFDTFYTASILSAAAVCILILSVLVIKYFSPQIYDDIGELWRDTFAVETEISDVLGDGK